jgi:hypothetical protein
LTSSVNMPPFRFYPVFLDNIKPAFGRISGLSNN